MSICKTLFAAGTAVFFGSAALGAAFQGRDIPLRASSLMAIGTKLHSGSPRKKGVGLCGTGFGSAPSTPDGIISWNDTTGSGYNTAAAADFVCQKPTTIKKVYIKGYNAPNNPEMYNVTIYKNDPAGGSNEANDAKKAVCSYTNLSGAGGYSYDDGIEAKLKLTKACRVGKGEYWVSVQNNDSLGPWYWEVQDTKGGNDVADWVDTNNKFGDGCTTLDNDEYLADCLGYTYPDYMLELH